MVSRADERGHMGLRSALEQAVHKGGLLFPGAGGAYRLASVDDTRPLGPHHSGRDRNDNRRLQGHSGRQLHHTDDTRNCLGDHSCCLCADLHRLCFRRCPRPGQDRAGAAPSGNEGVVPPLPRPFLPLCHAHPRRHTHTPFCCRPHSLRLPHRLHELLSSALSAAAQSGGLGRLFELCGYVPAAHVERHVLGRPGLDTAVERCVHAQLLFRRAGHGLPREQ